MSSNPHSQSSVTMRARARDTIQIAYIQEVILFPVLKGSIEVVAKS